VYAFERPRARTQAKASVRGGSGGRLSPHRSIRVGRRGMDTAWRLLAYDLLYRPAMRAAWRTLPRHPGLCAAALKVVPLASRRVPVGDGGR